MFQVDITNGLFLMLWFGITGGIGSGKSTLSRALRAQGFTVLDADAIARMVVLNGTPGFEAVVAEFGSDVVEASESGLELNRGKLSELVFKNKERLSKLESIMHPLIQNYILNEKEKLNLRGLPIAFYDVPLLYEKNMQNQFDKVILVYCTKQQQIERSMKRDGMSLQAVEQRIAIQISLEDKKNLADYVFDNSGAIEDWEIHFKKILIWIESKLIRKIQKA